MKRRWIIIATFVCALAVAAFVVAAECRSSDVRASGSVGGVRVDTTVDSETALALQKLGPGERRNVAAWVKTRSFPAA